MTTAAQFIEYLKTLPPDTEIKVVNVYDGAWCQLSENVDLNLDEHSDNCSLYDHQLFLGND